MAKNHIHFDWAAKGMKEVREKLNVMNMSVEERKQYNRYIGRLSDEASYAMTLKLEAEERVRKQRDNEIAIKCIKRGDTNIDIIEITDLTNSSMRPANAASKYSSPFSALSRRICSSVSA